MIEEPDRLEPPPRRGPQRIFLALLIGVIVTLGAAGSWFAWATGGSGSGPAVEVTIPSGASASTIADRLADAGVIRSAFAFRLVAKFRGISADFKPGTYTLRRGLSVSAAMDELREGVTEKALRFTVPEGLTVRQIAARVADRVDHITAAGFLAALTRTRDVPDAMAQRIRGRTTLRPEDFEGFLFPDTYEIFKKASATEIVRKMLDRFEQAAEQAGIGGGAQGLDPYEVVIVASLIEKEARCRRDLIAGNAPCGDDHVLIGSVIYNRLARPMRLQIDATIQYVFIRQTGRAKNPLQISDYQLDSPYNTYQIDGLPPTPIAAPGLESLRAAVDPAKSDFFFYRLCNADALRFGHVFGRTIQERDSKQRNDERCG